MFCVGYFTEPKKVVEKNARMTNETS